MGLLRFYLAISVIAAHGVVLPLPLMPAQTAVEVFFAISGFYISLILRTKYRGRVGAFYLNRALRLYPTYLLVLAATWTWPIALGVYIGHASGSGTEAYWSDMSLWDRGLISLSNLTMIGQDVLRLLHYKIGAGFVFLHQSPLDSNGAYIGVSEDGAKWVGEFQKIGQAWSLGIEVWFYALAPLLVWLRLRYLVFIAGLSFSIYAWILAGDYSFFTYFFFPANLGFFLIGVMLQRSASVSSLLLKHYAWDAWLGNLSYPIYVCHGLIITVFAVVHITSPLLLLAAVITISAAISRWLEEPIETLRQRIALMVGPSCGGARAMSNSVPATAASRDLRSECRDV